MVSFRIAARSAHVSDKSRNQSLRSTTANLPLVTAAGSDSGRRSMRQEAGLQTPTSTPSPRPRPKHASISSDSDDNLNDGKTYSSSQSRTPRSLQASRLHWRAAKTSSADLTAVSRPTRREGHTDDDSGGRDLHYDARSTGGRRRQRVVANHGRQRSPQRAADTQVGDIGLLLPVQSQHAACTVTVRLSTSSTG